jgi:hypothetical protein
MVHAHLSRPDLGSVIRAALIGVPMPLCSCGVVPTAIGLRNQGASKGATTSFLISTPQTGVDSVLVSASFLGWPFALFKLAAAFVTGVTGGWLVNRWTVQEPDQRRDDEQGEDLPAVRERLGGLFRYALFDLLAVIDLWLIAGILAAAAISTAVPPAYFEDIAWANGIGGMLLVLALSLPLYVCTTASVPIAASLIAAGMPAGSALVFLMAGPATNVATMGAIYRSLGIRVLGLYLGTVIVASIGLGLSFDFVISDVSPAAGTHAHGSVAWWQTGSALLLIGLLAFLLGRRFYRRYLSSTRAEAVSDADLVLKVEGMNCEHCVANVKRALEDLEGVEEADPDLATGFVKVKGDLPGSDTLSAALHKSGYRVVEGG